MGAERLAACPRAEILALDVIAFRATVVVVMHGLFDRMKRLNLRH